MEVADTYLQSNLVPYWSADRRPTARTTFPWAMPHADKKKEKSPKRKISIQSMDLVATIDGLEIQRTSWDTCFFCPSCVVWKLFDIIHCCIKRFLLLRWLRVFGVIAFVMSSKLQCLYDHCVEKISSKSCCASFSMSIMFVVVQLLITMNCFHSYSSYKFGCVCDFGTFNAFHPSW